MEVRRGPSPPGPRWGGGYTPWLTLRAHQRQGHLAGSPMAAEHLVELRHLLEAALVLQAEDEDDGVRPVGKLGRGHEEGVRAQPHTLPPRLPTPTDPAAPDHYHPRRP